ncbi:hypothetical protein [Methanimicrococcus hacksteinii]|uniref:hypothetical protein n=1 Tax=Methanimicrococcus hacksteinii TaxID=3028293 RepID=UPI00298F1C84|nr:hypothetical protein [Methanimicrococcus sp. At1]
MHQHIFITSVRCREREHICLTVRLQHRCSGCLLSAVRCLLSTVCGLIPSRQSVRRARALQVLKKEQNLNQS